MGMNPAILADTQAKIKSHGFSVIGVMDNPSFAYTIGLTGQFNLEFLMIGLRPDFATMILNHIVHEMKNGAEIKFGVPDDRFANLPCMFMEANLQRVHKEYVIQADAFYGKEVRVVQVVMSDRAGLLPHQPGYDQAYMGPRQKLMYYVPPSSETPQTSSST